MRRFIIAGVTCAVIFSLTATPQTLAAPPDQMISYTRHEDPSDPTSPVTHCIKLDLKYVSMNGNDVTWDVSEVLIERCSTQTKWSDPAPNVDTLNGYWVISHADGNDPQVSEFTEPPLIDGTADPEKPSDDDMVFEILGESTGTGPYTVTSIMDLYLRESLEPNPEVDDNDEPEEVNDDTPPDPQRIPRKEKNFGL